MKLDNLSQTICDKIVVKLDNWIERGFVEKIGVADARIFLTTETACFHLPDIAPLIDQGRILAADFLGTIPDDIDTLIMLNKVERVDRSNSSASGSGGGYHCDSFKARQIKVFCYLSNVIDKDDGAFEVTTKYVTLFLKILNLITFNRLNNKNSHLNRFDYIHRLPFITRMFDPVLGEKGYSFKADTGLVHRGRPTFTQTRYMLTLYLGQKNEKIFQKFKVQDVPAH